MLALGSPFGHKMASKICNMSLPKPKMHHMASQDCLPSPNMAPKMTPQTPGMALIAPIIALPQTDKPNFEGAVVIPEGIVNKLKVSISTNA